jgi:formate dehydrogenase accessory protein FdhE
MALATIQRRYSLEDRLRRAEQLTEQWPFSAEILRTYQLILQFQQSLAVVLRRSRVNGHSCRRLPQDLDLSPFLRDFKGLMSMAITAAPAEVAVVAKDVENFDATRWQRLLNSYWRNSENDARPAEAFLLHAFLQPIAEHVAASSELGQQEPRVPVCPFCERKPACGILRPEGDGAKRSLVCCFCSIEWDYRRLICPNCEQEDVEKLPIYTADEFPYIRIEACDVCKTFIKTVDLTKDGRPIPLVDEIGSVPLTLWAEEKGYRKLQSNLLLM